MSDSLPSEGGAVKHRDPRVTVRWSDDDLDRIDEVLRRRNERDHSDLTPSDLIRMATRRLLAEELDAPASAA